MPPGPVWPLGPAPELRSVRLRLEPWRPGQARALFDGLSDPLLYRFLSDQPPPDVAALARRIAREARGRSPDGADAWCNWTVSRVRGGRCLGTVQATIEATCPGRALIGYVVFRPHWRQGIGAEAVACMLDWLFGPAGCHAADALVDPANVPSLALLHRLGFEYAGVTVDAGAACGRSDEIALCLDRSRWRRRRNGQ